MTRAQSIEIELPDYPFEIFDRLPIEAALLTTDLRIAYMNTALTNTIGEESLGRKCYKVYQENLDKCKECPLSRPVPKGEKYQAICEGALGDKVIKFIHKAVEIDGHPYILEIWDDITEQRRAQKKLSWLASFAEKTPTPILEWDEDLNLTYQNPAAKKMEPPEDSESHPLAPENLDFLVRTLKNEKERSTFQELEFGGKVYIEYLYALPEESVVRAYAYDITSRREAEKKFRRSQRDLILLTRCNQLLVRATDEEELLEDICKTIVQDGGYCFAWVGYAEDNEEKTVRPVAKSGEEQGYLDDVQITWSEDNETGQGPTGQAIRSGNPSFAKSIPEDSSFEPWREDAVNRGYSSSIALPLQYDGQTYGALNIYATAPDAFEDRDIHLLTDLADDLAFGIYSLREQERRKATEEELEDLSKHLIEAREEERTRISRELHDEMGQLSTSTIIALSNLEEMDPIKDNLSTRDEVEEIIEMVENLDEKVRNLAVGLRPPALEELGLVSTLKADLNDINHRDGIQTKLEVDEDVESLLEDEEKVHIYRVIQEGLTNAIRHGNPTRLHVKLTRGEDSILLQVEDDGVGFDPDALVSNGKSQERLGLIGLRERIYALSGNLEINSSPESGTTISAEVPITKER